MVEQMHTTAESSRQAQVGYHLVASDVWREQRAQPRYQPEAYGEDGFIHLTLGLDPLLDVANMFYTGDPRAYRVLVLDLNKIEAGIRYEDPERIYPHVYGVLNTNAVIGELAVERNTDGRFLRIMMDPAES